ncbi:meiotic recombination protein SPO11 [Paragonimus westermani]|uniref:DNA topoisomerase (ATP-hydrolyzing) n=1 Tax=Paragonimus westermani TaxID=34504 RepID=A0A5J4P140_9TREM|nr:meiotic recombination protein SPO11 [Paragonimus westermani]
MQEQFYRSIYYGNPELFKHQNAVDRALARLCMWLEVPRWILRVRASGKLKLFGDLTWTIENGKSIRSAKDKILSLPDGDMSELGLGVFCTYKYGTQNPTMRNSKLSPVKIEKMELLGVLPSELQRASELTRLTKADRALLKGILQRSYFKTDNELMEQTIFMSNNGWKGEIEVLESLRSGYLCQEYLVNKLKNKKIFPTA